MTDNTQNTNEQNEQAKQAAAARPGFEMLRVYAKNCSLETPETPKIFREQWKPQVQVSFATATALVDQSKEDAPVHLASVEVTLRVTVTCKLGDKTAYICEVNQAGLFGLRNIKNPAEIEALLNAAAPNMLFPYAREAVANLINRGGFPALNLAHVDFALLYRARKLKEQQKAAEAAKTPAPANQPAEQKQD